MFLKKEIKLFLFAFLFSYLPLLQPVKARDLFNKHEALVEQRSENKKSTYVTYKTDPEHYDVPGNASRTCGPGYNPMSKRHRRNHRYKRPHVHPNVPWRKGCEKE